MKVYVLLPAFNEQASLASLLGKIFSVEVPGVDELIVVACDDGSSDGTGEILERFSQDHRLEVLEHRINRGLGETIRDLFEYATFDADPEDIVIRLDADDTHDPKYIPQMLGCMRDGADVVVASRFAPGGGQQGLNGYRKFISLCANNFMRFFFPIAGLKEYACGYRAYRASLLAQAIKIYGNDFIQLKGFGFACTLEKLVKLKLLGAKFAETPFQLRYDMKESGSKMVGSVTTLGYLVLVILYYWPWGGWRTYYRGLVNQERTDTGE